MVHEKQETEIILPEIKELEGKGNRMVFVIEPLFPGYGMTIANSLRRVLLSSLKGAAVTTIKIKDVPHEFMTIPFVREDVVQIILNIKCLRLKLHGDEPTTLFLRAKGPKEVKAKDIEKNPAVEIVNPDLTICTIEDKKGEIEIEMKVEKGLGYYPVEKRRKEKLPIGTIAIDAIFTPVTKVSYEVENTRVGGRTDYDKITIDITTDGTIHPREALETAASILVDHFAKISGHFEEIEEEQVFKKPMSAEGLEKLGIEEVNFSTRTMNVLLNNKIKYIGDLVKMSDEEIKNLKGLGEKAFLEIKAKLEELGIIKG